MPCPFRPCGGLGSFASRAYDCVCDGRPFPGRDPDPPGHVPARVHGHGRGLVHVHGRHGRRGHGRLCPFLHHDEGCGSVPCRGGVGANVSQNAR